MKKIAVIVSLLVCLSGCGNLKYVNPEIRGIYSASVSVLLNDDVNGAGTIIHNHRGDHIIVITAAHIVKKADNKKGKISITYGELKKEVEIYKIDYDLDLAILMGTKPENSDGPYVDISNGPGKIGDRIWIIGAPLGEKMTTTRGVISNRIEKNGKLLYRTDAAVFFGNSGGGMYNTEGQLVGVVHALKMIRFYGSVIIEPGGFYAISWESIKKFL